MVARDGARPRLAAGHDLTYHHDVELVFADPLFVSRPSGFHDPVFCAPTPGELLEVARRLGEAPPVVVVFGADAGGPEPVSCLIAADRLAIVQETVLRYGSEDAAPGTRSAPRVRAPGRQRCLSGSAMGPNPDAPWPVSRAAARSGHHPATLVRG
uniref:hypothetical protein n=1 Tax=Streptomyces sp. NBC_00101 TaxID=2975651 RepID=UPI003248239A